MRAHQIINSSLLLEESVSPNHASGLAWSAGRIVDKQDRLFDVEESAVAFAVEKRKAEFRAGRTCAREALRLLGCADMAIPRRPDRSPGWPSGFVGSISHTSSFATAIVAQNDLFAGLGIDIEEDVSLPSDLRQMIMRSDERERLPSNIMIGLQSVDTAKVIFSIKEAVYKAVRPLSGALFDFQDVAVTIDQRSNCYAANFQMPIHRFPYQTIEGSIGHAMGHVIATAMIPAGLGSPEAFRR